MQERDDFSSNRHPALTCSWSMIFSRKPVSTFRDHALSSPHRFLRARRGGMQARHDATVRLLTMLLAAVLLVPATLFAYAAWVSYRSTFALADERIQRSLDVVGEHAA